MIMHTIGRPLPVACLLACLSGHAFAHAVLQPDEAPANGTYRGVITISHGCNGEPTHAVRVELPEGVVAAQPMPKPGWTVSVETGPYARTYNLHGASVSEGVRAITWSGGNLPDDHFDEFVFRGTIADLEPGTTLAFRTTQTCTGSEIVWAELPAPGQNPYDLANPAPTLTIIEGAGGHRHEHGDDGTVAVGDLHIGTVFSRTTFGRSGAVYLVIENHGDSDDRLVTVSSPIAARAEVHEMTVENDVMRMAAVEGGLVVPAHGTVTLAPGGQHVMLMGLAGPLQHGTTFPLTLGFERAGEVTVTVPVLAAGADSLGGEHDHH
jgi:uncharacterized protein YcnI/copper(I)-binding protein